MEGLDRMVFSIVFDVDGMPPRKDGGHSMWNKDKEVNKLIDLRKQLDATLQKHQIPTPITDYIKLKVEIYLPEKYLEKSDIDNLVGGICDGIQKANYKSKLNGKYIQFEGTSVHPFNSFLCDDSRVLELDVKKIINEKKTFYRVLIESIDLNEIRAEKLHNNDIF